MTNRSPVDRAAIVAEVVRERHTRKVLADEPLDVATDRALIERVVASAAWAPFHLPAARAHRDGSARPSIVPWRCYLLDVAACRRFRAWLLQREDAGTMPRLLAACSALVLVTWLPDPPTSATPGATANAPPFEGTRENMEHIAAASAAVQTMLLSATAHGLHTFWATGVPFRAAESVAYLGIPEGEMLLAAIFVTTADGEQRAGVETRTSALRDRRGDLSTWSTWVNPREHG